MIETSIGTISDEHLTLIKYACVKNPALMENFMKFSELCDYYKAMGMSEDEAEDKAAEEFDFSEGTELFSNFIIDEIEERVSND